MKSTKLGKMATALAVLLLVLSGVAVVQWNAQPVEATESDNQTHKYTIEGFLNAEISTESDLNIKLRDLKTGEIHEEQTSEDFYEFTDIRAGWYQIIFPSQLEDGTAYMRKETEPIKVDENTIEDLQIDAELVEVTVEGYVVDEHNDPIENAVVTVEDMERGFTHSVETETITQDNETLSKYEVQIYESFVGRLKVEKDGYTPYVNPDFSVGEIDHYNLTVNTNGEGTVEIDPVQEEYEEGTEVNLTANATEGWYFEEWTGDYTGTEEEITITMDEDKTVAANFAEGIGTHNLTVNYNETRGAVEVDGVEVGDGWTDEYEEGTEVNLTANATSGWSFKNWTGDYEGTEKEINLTMDGDKGVTANFETTLSSIMQNDHTYHNVTLFTEPLIEGRLVDEDDRGIREEMDITLYNEELGRFQRTDGGPTFRIRAPANYDYTLVVDAPGYEPMVQEIVGLEGTEKLGRQSVGESETERFETDMEFDGVDTLTIEKTRTLNSGTEMKTLDNSSIGYLPMQIDMVLGDGDRTIGDEEIEHFQNRLSFSEADILTTQDLIKMEDNVYELEDYTIEFEGLDKLGEDFTEPFEGNITVTAEREYKIVGEEVDEEPYQVDLWVNHVHSYGNRRVFNYTLTIMDNHERYDESRENSFEQIPENVKVEGYTHLSIDPQSMEESESSHLVLDLREYEEGDVDIFIEREPRIFERDEDHYVIKKDTEAAIKSDYENAVSKAVNYTWTVDEEVIGYGEEITHAFNDTEETNLAVEVEESNGRIISNETLVVIEDEGPHGTIKVRGEEILESTTADEGEALNFSAENFVDEATDNISRYEWNFSDGSETRTGANLTNVTHTFDVPGSYNVTLNVTDPVGNWNEDQIVIDVNDTTKPEVVIKTEWNDQHTYESYVDHSDLTIGTNIAFNVTESSAHPEYEEGELENYTWWIDELEMKEEGQIWENVTFDDAGEYTIWANVTDVAGNYRNKSVTVNIRRGPSPNLMVQEDLRFSSDEIRAGDTVTISVNVTNQGDANATQIETVLRVDGELVEVSPEFYKDGEELNRTHIEPGEEIKVEIEWEPENDGDLKVNVNVTDAEEREHTELLWNNEVEETVSVDPPVWREYIVYALIPIIIIGVTVALYFYKDKIKEAMG
ncbi:MAG: PKD domain-containing protein [Candidatus Thermoplasmatota archaeon]